MVDGWSCDTQKLLDEFRIGIVGAGGLGSLIATMVSASVSSDSEIVVVDHDVVDLSNLHRQVTYMEDMEGKPKADCLRDVCKARNKSCNIRSIVTKITPSNASEILSNWDIIFDCTDNLESRFAISDSWVQLGRRQVLISASCVGWSGKIVTLVPHSTSCIRCLFSGVPDDAICQQSGQCAIQGVMGPVVGIIANMQLLELFNYVKRIVMPKDTPPVVHLVDMSQGSLWSYDYELVPSCRACLPIGNDFPETVIEKTRGVPEITKSELLNLATNTCNLCIIDVRESNHFKLARLRGSVNFPASRDVEELVNFLSGKDSNSPIVIVCRRGFNSAKVVSSLLSRELNKQLFSLEGGLLGLGVSCFIYFGVFFSLQYSEINYP